MTYLPIRVVKVGGSLLLYRDLPQTLSRWLGSQPAAVHVCIAGGGPLADCIRDVDQLHRIGDPVGHWLCIQLLEVSGQLLTRLLGDACHVATWNDLCRQIDAAKPQQPIVFTTQAFLRQQEPGLPGHPLPHDWRTSSDSIAARVAQTLRADELVLLKSCPLPDGVSWTQAAACHLVDEWFPRAADGLAVRWVNLRAAEP